MAESTRVEIDYVWEFTNPSVRPADTEADGFLSPGMMDAIQATPDFEMVHWQNPADTNTYVIGKRLPLTASGNFAVHYFLPQADLTEITVFVDNIRLGALEEYLHFVRWRCTETFLRTGDLAAYLRLDWYLFLVTAHYITREEYTILTQVIQCRVFTRELNTLQDGRLLHAVRICTSSIERMDMATLPAAQMQNGTTDMPGMLQCSKALLGLVSNRRNPTQLALEQNLAREIRILPGFPAMSDVFRNMLHDEFLAEVQDILDSLSTWPADDELFDAINDFLRRHQQIGLVTCFDDIFIVAEVCALPQHHPALMQLQHEINLYAKTLEAHVASLYLRDTVSDTVIALTGLQANPQLFHDVVDYISPCETMLNSIYALCKLVQSAERRQALPPRFSQPVLIEDDGMED